MSKRSDCAASLCYSQHQHLSLPRSWKSEAAQLLIRSMHIEFDAPICRPCRDDISRLVKNQQYIPRWTKATQKTCCIPGCNATAYLPSIPDYPGIEAIIPDPRLHADFPGIQANLPGSRILRKNTTFHTGMASCVRIFCRQCSQVRARQRA